MEITKFKGSEVLSHIRHDLRQIPEGKTYGNENVDVKLSKNNYSLIDRGDTVEKVNQYRKEFEKKIFKYKRKNLVHAVELVIQAPADCPPEQHRLFFETAFNWYCDTYLPAGKECVFVAEVHRDEHRYVNTINGEKDISKEHLHIMYVPAVEAGPKHPEYKYRLNADQLTKRTILKNMHQSLKDKIENTPNLTATVLRKKDSGGKTISLSVEQLKELTDKTGIVLDHSLTFEELVEILQEREALIELIKNKDKIIEQNHQTIDTLLHEIDKSQEKLQEIEKAKTKEYTIEY